MASDGAFQEDFEYLKDAVKSYDADFFIHSWDVDIEDHLTECFNPKVKCFESQLGFKEEMSRLRVPHRFVYSDNGDLFKTLSFTYSRMRSVNLKKQYEVENKIKYDCVLISRFDVGHHNQGRNKTSKLKFNPNEDMDKIYQAYWDQTNAGVTDHWFYGSSKLMDQVGDLYNHVIDYLQPDSGYIEASENGWPLSDNSNEFSNELFKPESERSTKPQLRGRYWQLNNHCLYKWHFMEMGKWNLSDCVFLNKELW